MTIIQTIILGVVQGITEFLPVSSSGHLVLVPHLLGWNMTDSQAFFVFDVLVQVATLLAVLIYFWQDLIAIIRAFIAGLIQRRPFADPLARIGWYLILATIPAGLIGFLFQDAVEAAFGSLLMTSVFLWVTAALLVIAERSGRHFRQIEEMSWVDSLWFGVFQVLAIFPGVSRSGSTMTGGMERHFDRPAAARFSFLMSIPVMLAAGLLASVKLVKTPGVEALLPTFIPGFITAAVVGYLAIRWLLRYLINHRLYVFAAYCAVVGSLGLILVMLNR